MTKRSSLAILIALACLSAQAADTPVKSGPIAAEAPASPAAGASAADFAKRSKEFNDLIAEMTGMQSEYAATGSAEVKAAIAKKFNADREKAEVQAGQLIDAAEKAFAESPNKDPEVIKVLVGTLVDQIERDDYEPAFKIGKLLMDNKCPTPAVAALAGIAAYCVNEYDLAEPWLKIAKASGALEQVCKEIQQRDHADAPRYYVSYPELVASTKAGWEKEKAIRDAEEKAGDLPRVLMKTSKGDIVIELFENEAPNTVLNFITLVDKGFYTDVKFHRVLPGFMAQGGDPKGTGNGGPGYTIPDEFAAPNHRLHFRGSLSMARTENPNSGGSQFFLAFTPTKHLDDKYTVFGRIINTPEVDSFAVLSKLKRINPEESNTAGADTIKEAKVIRRRSHPYEEKDLKKSGNHD